MTTERERQPTGRSGRASMWIGAALLATGLLGHLLAANAEGGRGIHYRHHILGFVILSVVSAVLIAGLGRLFWRGRHDITLLIVGAMQTLFGFLIYAMFSSG